MHQNDPVVGPAETATGSRRFGLRHGVGSIVLLLLITGRFFGVLDSRAIRVERVTVPCRGLPRSLAGFSIIQLSDLHSRPDFDLNRQVAWLLGGLRADAMVITGDFRNRAGTSRDAAEGARIVVAPVLRRIPVFAVRGNNDHAETMRLLVREGIRVLDNQAVPVRDGLWFAGWDPYEKRHPLLSEVLRPVPSDAVLVLAAHSPDVILKDGFERAQLILVGHTHGLQIRIPGLPSPITNTHVGWRYTRGLYEVKGSRLYINRGIGTTLIPLRVYSAPEITVITLVPSGN